MGKLLGAYDADMNNEREDLNKCPDCECFFAQDVCPMCGKPCPEEMRAGNRKPVKQKRYRRSRGSGRVTFVEWYHSWWFIVIMMFFMPIVGIILLFTSPHKTAHKVIFIVLAVAYIILITFGGLFDALGVIGNMFEKPIDTSLSREEYVSECVSLEAEEYYRASDSYKGKFVSLELTIVCSAESWEHYGSKYDVFYLCCGEDGDAFQILIRDCIQDASQNFISGDRIRIYGEGAEIVEASNNRGDYFYVPCINVAYYEMIKN